MPALYGTSKPARAPSATHRLIKQLSLLHYYRLACSALVPAQFYAALTGGVFGRVEFTAT